MDKDEALKLALEAADEIEWMLKNGYDRGSEGPPRAHRLVSMLRALAQPAPYMAGGPLDGLIGYTPPAAPTVQEPLTWLKTIETLGGFGKFVEAKPNEKGAKPVYLAPPAKPAPVPIKPVVDPDLDVNQRLAFKLGWKSAEEAHGITEKGQP